MTWGRVGLIAVKAFHSVVFFALTGALVDFFWSAVRGRSDRRAALAGVTVDAEWSFNAGGGGTQLCMNSGSQNPQRSAGNNDQASAVKIFASASAC